MGPKKPLGLRRESQGSGKVIAANQLLPSLHLLRCSHLSPGVGGNEEETEGETEEGGTDPYNCQVSFTPGPLALLLEATSPLLSL